MTTRELAEKLREAAALLDALPSTTDALRATQHVLNVTRAAQVGLVETLVERREHEGEGCSSVKNWLRDQLRIDASAAQRLIRAGRTFDELPRIAEAAEAGVISLQHVDSFSFGLKHVDRQVIVDAEDWMLRLAVAAEPAQLRTATRRLRDVAHPDELDEQWLRGMDRHDVRLHPVGDGYHLTGFLPADTGAKFRTVLSSLSAPTCAEDDRPASERRITALDELLTGVLAGGLPTDKGVRPHIDVTVDLADLAENPDATTAQLAGFGTIGPRQLQQLLCSADLTPILHSGKHAVLDVGRAVRLGTPAQRRAVSLRQGGLCLGPGCRGPVVHIHHVTYWSHGGGTDLANLVGLCPRCHSLVHAGHYAIDPTTHAVTRTVAGRLRSHPVHARAG